MNNSFSNQNNNINVSDVMNQIEIAVLSLNEVSNTLKSLQATQDMNGGGEWMEKLSNIWKSRKTSVPQQVNNEVEDDDEDDNMAELMGGNTETDVDLYPTKLEVVDYNSDVDSDESVLLPLPE